MSSFFAVFLVLLLASASYAAGRLHGQLSYRIGYRFGYRQGYFDGDRGAWTRRRRETRAAIASVLPEPARPVATGVDLAVRPGTTYTGAAVVGGPGLGGPGFGGTGGRHSTELLAGRHP
ncbi:hypothetical protein O7621_11555 [Solwaraspora sp. WMMD937]|uniref:hypothetical protein n=1 Tax=Solwaraspora sp. WMMD937 TaxID=3016090 RepID=UPI00249B6FE9|nr:hypothetical protein [Solwaraspora sp. WMMD937]WFE23844.1 hypothetical protein O7621_11555 [Solwaraspora sp. WMMD937]